MRNLDDFDVLILPGLGGSGAEHWHTFWEAAFPQFTRVEQSEWERPRYADWAATLTAALARCRKPAVFVAHSLGTSLVMRWSHDNAALARAKVAGAFLAAPTDRDPLDCLPDTPAKGFGPMILERLPFPSMVVASRDDDRVTFARAQTFAAAWGADFVDAGAHGHLGSAAQLGLWPFGLVYFGQLLATLRG